jgi:class 3 adenylate cyclase/tetratricopeptide (TPR) repeat protein
LPQLSDDDLKGLGLPLGHRRKLQAALKDRAAARAAEDVPDVAAVDRSIDRRSAAEAERRQLTVMFCDLVGSTALSAKLDPEDLREVMRVYQEAVTGVVTRYDGHVAKYLGDGVLAYFGWPRAHEDDAERAVRAGLDAVAAVSALAPREGVRLEARAGIATGPVVVGDVVGGGVVEAGAVAGETPNLAARLQGIAAPGTVTIGESTHRLAGAVFECRDLGARDLQGFAAPVRAWSVVRPRRAESRFEVTRGGHLTELIGREDEVDLLHRRWQRAKRGEGQVVLIAGEPGIGKSRLVRSLQERIADEPHTQVRLQCSPFHVNSPFYPIIEHFERTTGFAAGDRATTKLDKLEALLAQSGPAAEIAPLIAALLSIPAEGRYPPLAVSPQRQKELTIKALAERLRPLSAKQPVLFVIEDAHWIDPTTLEFIDRLIETVPETRAIALITFRPELAAPWVGRPRVTLMSLGRLDRGECAAMVEKVAGRQSLAVAVRDRIVEQTDGVPLFVEELTRTVVEADKPGAVKGSAVAPAIPATLQDSLIARLDQLGAAKEVAQIASVIGREFPHALLAGVTPCPPGELAAALDKLIDAGLVFRRGAPPEAVYTFKHALVQDAAYASLVRGRRQDIHRRIAKTLQNDAFAVGEAEPEILAHHHTSAGQIETGAEYWLKAGESALRRSALREGAAHIARGLEVIKALPDEVTRSGFEARFHLARASAMRRIHGPAHPEVVESYGRAYALCRYAGDEANLFVSLTGIKTALEARGDLTQSRENLFEILHLAGQDPARLAVAHTVAAETFLILGEHHEALRHAEAAKQHYDRRLHRVLTVTYGRQVGVFIGTYSAFTEFALGHPDAALSAAQFGTDHARSLGDDQAACFALMIEAGIRALRGEVTIALHKAAECEAFIEERGYSHVSLFASVVRDWAEFALRPAQECLSRLSGALSEWRAVGAHRQWWPWVEILLAEALIRDERGAESLARLDDVLSWIAESGAAQFESLARSTKADALRALADDAEAEHCYQKAITVARSQSAKSWELCAATRLARLWQTQGKTAEARDLLAPVYGWFTEGFDTADLKAAKALLDEPGPGRSAPTNN